MALLSRFFGRTASEGAAFAFGLATGPVLGPAVEVLRQDAWDTYRSRIPGVLELAAGVAQGQVDPTEAATWAHRQGFSDEAFGALVNVANTGPDVGMAMQAWRRGFLTEAQFRTVLKRHALEDQWDDALVKLKAELLAPADLARAIHRGLIPAEGLLVGTPPSGVGNVPAYPVYPIDAITEAAGWGLDHDRLGVLVGLQGLPMGSHEAAQALFRGVLTEDDYLRAIAEGNTRNEWADAIREQSRVIPTVAQYVAAWLRGWITQTQRDAGTARHGMTAADTALVAQAAGRPVTTRQAFVGFIRGGRVQGERWDERETFRRAVVQSNIRPEWEPILWAQRYSYPSAFVLRALTQAGDISEADALQVLTFSGWEPTFAEKVAAAWAPSGATKASPYVGKAETQLWTQTHKSYIGEEITDAQTGRALTTLGLDAATQTAVLRFWKAERDLIRKQLSPAQIVKAYKKGTFTRDVATTRLVNLGYTLADAGTLLDDA